MFDIPRMRPHLRPLFPEFCMSLRDVCTLCMHRGDSISPVYTFVCLCCEHAPSMKILLHVYKYIYILHYYEETLIIKSKISLAFETVEL